MSLETIHRFYDAFAKMDAETMAACYADDVTFSDAVFIGLRGEEARDMWRMLCSRATDLVVEKSKVRMEGDVGHAHWDARYSFGQPGGKKRPVLNRIDATFKFRDGLIVDHRDDFNLYAWTRMALGPVGIFMGWTPMVQNAVRKQARGGLKAFQREKAAKAAKAA